MDRESVNRSVRQWSRAPVRAAIAAVLDQMVASMVGDNQTWLITLAIVIRFLGSRAVTRFGGRRTAAHASRLPFAQRLAIVSTTVLVAVLGGVTLGSSDQPAASRAGGGYAAQARAWETP